ncbi:hypothetical protein H4R18_005725 [Coemansia javaensis]|uniref:Uncharacterized protein n=1 Tax=Coemansia javaensis TaxID=2761396 RepID=A0A9W8LCV5_9FUNG|nr:hypothetical protein H4R18_005725 [Coemansia javaensis]
MGCRKCRGWEESECCLSQPTTCSCACHAACDCAFCHTVELKTRSWPGMAHTVSCRGRAAAAPRIPAALRADPRLSFGSDGPTSTRSSTETRASSDEAKADRTRWRSLRNSTLKPLRMFA